MEFEHQLANLTTETRNMATRNIDTMSTEEIVTLICREDRQVIEAVAKEIPHIVAAAELVTKKIKEGGRLFYLGSGTSGRLGILDAAELLPTFGVGEDVVKAIIAGGTQALFTPVEQAEDDYEAGIKDLLAENPTAKDVVLGISASGRTPYVLGALHKAIEIGASTIGLTCNDNTVIAEVAEITIAPVVGPEVVTGSTRMKAGTAQKMVLNTLSTTVMIKLGKVYQNLMVDMIPTNAKLMKRAERIVMDATGASLEETQKALRDAESNIKAAIVMIETERDYESALQLLEQADGVVGRALQLADE